MRLPVIIIFVLFICLQNTECRSTWSPQSLVERFSNKTSDITSYVRDKGKSLRDFYVVNVRNKITSYFTVENETKPYDAKESNEITNRKFKTYIENAQNTNSNIYDTIAPKDMEYKCSDDDPTIYMSTPQLIAIHEYPAESHSLVTDDGYILTIHRIPFSKKSTRKEIPTKTVLLHHGLLGSSADWVIPGPEKGLAYILSDAGYDVWMANVRGNTYSRAHTHRLVDTFEFWNFTFHEISQHDLPAVIDYIMETKGSDTKINYIGHSMGTTVLFAMLSTKTQYNKILRAGFALAPVAYMTDIRSPLKILAKFGNSIEYLMKLLGVNEFLPQNAVLRWLSKHACEINHYEEAICENSMFVICGHDDQQFNKTLLPTILGHVPAGASTKTLVHYAQEIRNGGMFQQFDYGSADNMKYYGTVNPPEYPLYKITLPIALISAQNDWLASEIAVKNLFAQLVNPIEHYVVPLKQFNHIDFLWAIDAPVLVYDKLVQLLEDAKTTTYIDLEITSNKNEIDNKV